MGSGSTKRASESRFSKGGAFGGVLPVFAAMGVAIDPIWGATPCANRLTERAVAARTPLRPRNSLRVIVKTGTTLSLLSPSIIYDPEIETSMPA
jgi:hypothetical protein